MGEYDAAATEKLFFDNHTKFVNHVVSKAFVLLAIAPVVVFVCTMLGVYNCSRLLATVLLLWSAFLVVLVQILVRFNVNKTVFKYFVMVSTQSVVFLLSLDVNLQLHVAQLTMPLLTFMYFDPKFSLVACIAATVSTFVATCLTSAQSVAMFWPGITPQWYIFTTGGSMIMEFALVSVMLYVSALQAKKFMVGTIQRNAKVSAMQKQMVYGFADIIESRDEVTGQHVKRTSQTVSMILDYIVAHDLYKTELTEKDLPYIPMAAPLHDIGKLKVSDSILCKNGALTQEEFEKIKTHAAEGSKIICSTLVDIEDPRYVQIASDMALFHHERWDGTGYPEKRRGSDIPIAARIMAIADVFDALCCKRPYKEAFSVGDAFMILDRSRDKHFESQMVDIMIALRPELEKIYGVA